VLRNFAQTIPDFINGIDPTRTSGSPVSVETICGFDHGVASPGKRTVKTEPLPGSLATVTSGRADAALRRADVGC
jgi:hypothetical protein